MFMIRLLIVGETGVGKTSLLVRFNEGNFYSDQKTTIGVDYKAKEIDIDGEVVKLQVYGYLVEDSSFCLRLTLSMLDVHFRFGIQLVRNVSGQ